MKNIFCILTSFILMSSAYAGESQILTAENFLYVSGQFPTNPTTGIMETGPIAHLTTVTIDNIQSLLKIKGGNLNQVIKTTVYLADIRDYDAMDAAYSALFTSKTPPTREVVEVSNMPLKSRIQISCVADLLRINL